MGINFDEEQIDEIKVRNDIVNTISKYVSLKKSGQNYTGLCPFHGEKTPSFTVSEEKQFYHCFGCGEAGDVISFIMKIENLDFIDAITLLGERVGIQGEDISTSKQEKEELNKKNKIYELNREAALFFHRSLVTKQNDGLRYLNKRGLKPETIKKFGLGFADASWESLSKHLADKGFIHGLMYEAGLVYKRKEGEGYFDRFRNRIIFPIINSTGKVIGFGGRSIDESMPKYLNTPETPVFNKGNNLFAINLAKKEIGSAKRIIVVEGYMDVISLYQNGINYVVATLGTALTKNQGNLLKRYADEVLIAYDTDSAGQAATIRGMDLLNDIGCKVKVIHLSDGKDPDELVRKKGKNGFLEEIVNAFSLIDYKIFLSKKENDLATVEGKIQFVKSITNVLKSIKSPVVVDAYIHKIAAESDISIDAIKSEIYGNNRIDQSNDQIVSMTGKYRSKNDRNNNKYNIQPMKAMKKDGFMEAERSLLKLIINDKDLFLKNKALISYEDFSDKVHQKIATIVFSLYEQYTKIEKEMIAHQLEADELLVLQTIIDSILPEENHQKAIADYVRNMAKFGLENKKKGIELELKKLESIQNKLPDQIVRIRELCIDYEKLMKKMKNL